MLSTNYSFIHTLRSGFNEGIALKTRLLKPYHKVLITLVFVFIAASICHERPMKRWLVIPAFVGIWLAKVFKWAVTAFSIYVLFSHGIHSPWWLTVGSLLTTVLVDIAFAAAKMEMNHIGYLNS